MPFYAALVYTSRARAERAAARLNVCALSVLVEVCGVRWSIARAGRVEFVASPCTGAGGKSRYGTLSSVLDQIGMR